MSRSPVIDVVRFVACVDCSRSDAAAYVRKIVGESNQDKLSLGVQLDYISVSTSMIETISHRLMKKIRGNREGKQVQDLLANLKEQGYEFCEPKVENEIVNINGIYLHIAPNSCCENENRQRILLYINGGKNKKVSRCGFRCLVNIIVNKSGVVPLNDTRVMLLDLPSRKLFSSEKFNCNEPVTEEYIEETTDIFRTAILSEPSLMEARPSTFII